MVADAFCHNMVRALVGALLAVGEGTPPAGLARAGAPAAVRDPAVRVVAPHGLCLEEVRYPAADQLAARAAHTRRVRDAASPVRGAGARAPVELRADAELGLAVGPALGVAAALVRPSAG